MTSLRSLSELLNVVELTIEVQFLMKEKIVPLRTAEISTVFLIYKKISCPCYLMKHAILFFLGTNRVWLSIG